MTILTTAKVQQDLNLIHKLVAQGGPEKHQYEDIMERSVNLSQPLQHYFCQ